MGVGDTARGSPLLVKEEHGYLTYKKMHPPRTVGLCLGPYAGPEGGGLFLVSHVPLYLAHKKHLPPQDHHRSCDIGLLQGPTGGGGIMSEVPL